MKKISVLPFLSLACLALTLTEVLAQTRLVNIQTVTVGDAGNAPQNSFDNRGAVGYPYRIGKFEITVKQYTAFLNSVASITTNDYLITLWNLQMGDKPWYAGVDRSGNGTPSDPYKYTVIGNADFPIDNVSWFDAARFCNWLHNGATNGASTETGAYTLNGATDGVIDKNTNAKWWIPSFNEWWKAAYYKGGGTNAGYWTYPTQSDSRPGNIIGGGSNQANYAKDSLYSVTQSTSYSPSQDYRTAVGTFSNSPSAYGTFDQAGNILEWNDATFQGYVTALVGGNWNSAEGELSGTTSAGTWDRGREWPGWGFRVAGVPDEDADDDGVNDYREDKDDTDPNDPNSFNPLSKGLALYYQLDGNQLDSSGHFNDLTNSTSGFAFATDRFGTPSSAAYFTGPNDGADSEQSLGITGNQSRTISFWFKATNSGAFFHMGNRVVETEADRATAFGIIAFVSQTNIIFDAWGNWADAWTEEVIVPEGPPQWRHLVYSYAGNKVGDAKLYIDGRPVIFTQSTDAEFKTIDGPIALGQNFLGPIFARTIADSSLDEFRVYNRALSDSEVVSLYYSEAFNSIQRTFLAANPTVQGHFSSAEYNVNRTNGQADVTTNPSAFNLFTAQQYEASYSNGLSAGVSMVLSNPESYNLYTSDSIMDLRMGGLMLQKQGSRAIVTFQPQTTTDLTQPFTNNGTPITNEVPMPGNKGFIRINAKP